MSPGKLLLCWLLVFSLATTALRCSRQYDEPPVYRADELKPTISIRELRKMHLMGGFEQIADDHIIAGVVIANDSTDNFYKQLVIQDSTGGITIRLDGTSLYGVYPLGMKLFIRLKDLWLGDYARMIQLGAAVDRTDPLYPELTGIPQPLFNRYIVRGSRDNAVTPFHVTQDQLTDSLQSCLVMLEKMEFAVVDTGKTYADVVNKLSANRTLKNCSGGGVLLRTSGFASFAKAKIPRGNGTATGIYSVFNTEKQLMVRDTSDIQLTGLRCTGTGAKRLFAEDFESATPNAELQLNGWKNISETGRLKYSLKQAAGNRYAEISCFASAEANSTVWLISPPIALNNSANEVLSFQTRDGFDNGATLQVYVSGNYDGGSTPGKAKWALLKPQVAKGTQGAANGGWVSSGNISLSGFSGTIYLGFRYEGADPPAQTAKRTTTFQLDNLVLSGN